MKKNKYNVRQLAKQIESGLSDKDVFLSDAFASYAETLVASLTRTRKGTIHTDISFDPDSEQTAATEGATIRANLGHSLPQSYRKPTDRLLAALGLLMHECAHIRFFDFKRYKMCMREYEQGRLYGGDPKPETPEQEEALDGIRTLLKTPSGRGIIVDIIATMDNNIIDAHDEAALCACGGVMTRRGIGLLSEAMRSTFPTVESMEYAGWSDLSIIMNLVLAYARYQTFFVESAETLETNEFIQSVKQMAGNLDRARLLDDTVARFQHYNRALLCFWPYIKCFATLPEASSSPDSDGDDTERTSNQAGQTGQGSPSRRDGSSGQSGQRERSAPGGCDGPRSDKDAAGSSGNAEASAAQSVSGSAETPKNASPGKKNGQRGGEPGTTEKVSGASGSSAMPTGDSQGSSGTAPQNQLPQFDDQAISRIIEALKKGSDGAAKTQRPENTNAVPKKSKAAKPMGSGNDAEDARDDANAAADNLLRLLKGEIAKEQADAAMDEQITSDTLMVIRGVSQTSAHAGLPLHVANPQVTPMGKQHYEALMREIGPYSRALQREIDRAIKLRENDECEHHMPFGRTVSPRDLYRKDQRFFDAKKHPGSPADIAISILIDRSGSMTTGCPSRIESAVKAAALVYDFARSLNIPVMVAGHHNSEFGSGEGIDMSINATFEPRHDDKYRICDLTCSARGNRDGMAIQVMADVLSKRPETIKLLIVVSDGQPYSANYSGDAAKKDIKSIIATYKRKGVTTIATAIGDDKERIRDIYGEGFVDITNLATFPKTLCKLIVKRIEI